ncbi:MAG: aminoacyl-histidine dipeptidase [Bacteroidetes bacterium]|nr:aminoacyl-histidine dipeptidase [Bacteroidota bacterium]
MEEKIAQLNPPRLWHYFLEICRIPRPSKKEEKIIKYLLDFGKEKGLETLQDEIGNVLIRKPAMPGYENAPSVVLQSHVDMVCEKNSATVHDFDKDPIIPWIDGEWIKAKGTTLGADDGIGIAAMLALLESKEIPHGPLECLFTIDEETGLTGAFGLKSGFLKSSVLLNLDSEDEGQLFIGCAGGADTTASFELKTEPVPSGMVAWKVSITGLTGGHSGDDINKGLGNAVKILNRFLWNATRKFYTRISSIDAGNLRNAIAREGFAIILLPEEHREEFEKYATAYQEILKVELHTTEPNLKFNAEPAPLPESVLMPDLEFWLLNALYACPHGVIEYSRDIPNFVETSTNLASVKFRDENIVITTSQRSSVESAKRDILDMVASVFHLAGATVEQSTGYPGWKPNPDSAVLKLSVESYRRLFSQEPKVLAIHAGLECGLIGALYPGMDMVSFGPTIKGAHSPDERLDIASAVKFWDLLVDILSRIK